MHTQPIIIIPGSQEPIPAGSLKHPISWKNYLHSVICDAYYVKLHAAGTKGAYLYVLLTLEPLSIFFHKHRVCTI